MLKTTSATIALLALSASLTVSLTDPALAAGCASSAEAAALKTAVMQQELMVAALQCHEASAYNHFVIAYRPELQDSDAALKAFFVRRGGEHGEAGYDTFKTKAANLSALEQARDSRAFCADAHALVVAALANHGTLANFVESRAGATDIGNVCVESRPSPVLAKAELRPVEKPVQVAAAKPLVKVADARPAVTVTDIGGVPSHSAPSIPYRHEDAPPPAPRYASRDEGRDMRDEDARPTYANADEEDVAPPPRPRYTQVRNYDDDYYAPRSYGPPRDWRQSGYQAPQQAPQQDWRDAPPPPRWYPQGGYYGNGW
jgi:hypothetical protein